MTLETLLKLLADNPAYVVFYFTILPISVLLAGWLGKGEGHLSPWKYIYATIIYLVSIPGIFAITLTIYSFLFERGSIWSADIFTQILPILSMFWTIWLIQKRVNLDDIPGFKKISGLLLIIAATFIFLWIIDRSRIFIFSQIRFEFLLFIFFGLFLAFYLGWLRLTRR